MGPFARGVLRRCGVDGGEAGSAAPGTPHITRRAGDLTDGERLDRATSRTGVSVRERAVGRGVRERVERSMGRGWEWVRAERPGERSLGRGVGGRGREAERPRCKVGCLRLRMEGGERSSVALDWLGLPNSPQKA